MKLSMFFYFFNCHKCSTSKDSNKTKSNSNYSKLLTEVNRTKRKCEYKEAYNLSNIPKVFIAKMLHIFFALLCLFENNIIAPAINGNENTPNIAIIIKISPILFMIFLIIYV